MDDAIGLYIHIPFCRHKCFYCDFNSVAGEENRIDDYINALVREIKFQSRVVACRKVVSLFLGGGTPSLLEPEHVSRIIAACRADASLTNDTEITVEMNPESVDAEKLKGYIIAGVNRVSIGIQSLNDNELKFLERIHTADEARQAVKTALNAGFKNVSADMIFNLPGQTLEGWLEQIGEVAGWGLAHISCYELTQEKGTPLGQSVDRGEIILPEHGTDLFDETEKLLEGRGYTHYEISNYAKAGFECVHNLGYWNYRGYLGLGAGAVSAIGGKRWENIKSVDGYINGVSTNGSAVLRTEELTCDTAVTERLMLGLRLKEGIAYDDKLISPKMQSMIAEGFIQVANGKIKATGQGWRLLDSLLVKL